MIILMIKIVFSVIVMVCFYCSFVYFTDSDIKYEVDKTFLKYRNFIIFNSNFYKIKRNYIKNYYEKEIKPLNISEIEKLKLSLEKSKELEINGDLLESIFAGFLPLELESFFTEEQIKELFKYENKE
jgi:hypothetical protein